MADNLSVTTESTWEADVTQSGTPVLVDFWATWCGPCRALVPHLESLSSDLDGKLKVVKLNVEEHPGIAQKFGVSGLPVLILFKGGEMVDRIQGKPSAKKLRDFVNPHV